MSKNLSSYFPADTYYFYGLPSGNASHFLNKASPFSEELMSARALSCAGENVKVVCFSNGADPKALNILRNNLELPLTPENQIIRFSKKIDFRIVGETRATMVQKEIHSLIPDHHFVMAQPYKGSATEKKYLIPRETCLWLNDKASLADLIPPEHLLEIYEIFKDGKQFASYSTGTPPLPCVVKVSNSSAGDGVFICKTEEDLVNAQSTFAEIASTILLQEYVEKAHDIEVQFGIPPNLKDPADNLRPR